MHTHFQGCALPSAAGFSGFVPSAGYGYGSFHGFRSSFAALREPYEVQKLLQEAIEKSKIEKAEVGAVANFLSGAHQFS